MKSQIKQLLLLFLSVLFMLTSCQNESIEETDPTNGDLVTQNSEVANLVLNMAARDGSFDNILDRNHCTEIKLPVTVVVRDIEIIIDTVEDLETLERIFDEFEDDLDELDFLFPITVILVNHTEVVIENQDRLEALLEQCEEDDDDIECIDFEYPITIAVFDDNNERIGTETFENDRQLYRFFKNLKDNEFVSFNFPMILVDSEGERVTINDNDELKEAIRIARNECDEDDDNDFNDDDFSVERLKNYLVECPFAVQHFVRDTDDLTNEYYRYVVDFKEDGTLIASRMPDGVPVNGEWEVREAEDGRPVLLINLGQLTDFNNIWLVYEIDDDKIKLFTPGSRIILHQRCDDTNEECDVNEVADKLENCKWRIAKFDGDTSFDDLIVDFSDRNIHALLNGEVVDEGNWNITETTVEFNVLSERIQMINGSWTVSECDSDRLVMYNGEQQELILEKDCEEDTTDNDVEAILGYLQQGEWKVADYDYSSVPGTDETNYDIYSFTFTMDGKMIATNPNMVETEGAYSVYRDENGKLRFKVLDFVQPDLLEMLDGEFDIVKVEENRLEAFVEYSQSTKKVVYEKIQ